MVKVLCYKSEGRWFDPSWCQWIFHWHKILSIALWPWGRLSLLQKWVPGAFSGGKGGQCVGLTALPASCAVVMKSGNLNLLEPSGPLQACNGTALPLLLQSVTEGPDVVVKITVWCWVVLVWDLVLETASPDKFIWFSSVIVSCWDSALKWVTF